MPIVCPNCGMEIKGIFGRKPLNIPLENIYEALQAYKNVDATANFLSCSQGYIYDRLSEDGQTPRRFLNGEPKLC